MATRCHYSSLEIENNKAKYRQIDFLSSTLKPEVRSSCEVFVITKWTSILIGLSC